MDVAILGATGDVGRSICGTLIERGELGTGSRLQLVGRSSGASACDASARRAAPMSAAGSSPLKLKPLALPSAIASGVASTTVSASPPTWRTTGTVP